MPSVNAPAAKFAKGQAEPTLDGEAPLALELDDYVPTWEMHPPQGTFTDDMLPEGTKRPKMFDSNVEMPYSTNLALKNRVVVSPMCQYSARDGMPSAYLLGHHASWALHGAGSIIVEASGVTAAGRITPQCLGIWNDKQAVAHASLVSALRTMAPGLTMGIQLAHAGRKASTWSPFHRGTKKQPHYVTDAEGGWEADVIAPSALAYGEGWIKPRELSTKEMEELHDQFLQAAERAFNAGYDFVEVHAAHGYFLHSTLSPISNQRTDAYGGSFEGRTKLLLDIVRSIRSKWPEKTLAVRISATDFCEAESEPSWDIEESKKLAKLLDTERVDILDVSAGGLSPLQRIKPGPGYQLPFAAEIKKDNPKMLVAAVGMMEGPTNESAGTLAEQALTDGQCDLVLLARGFLSNPKWVEEAAANLVGVKCAGNPQYHRAHPAKRPPPTAQNHN